MIVPHFKDTQRELATRFTIFLCGVFIFMLGVNYARIDIATSAKYFDGLNLVPVLNDVMSFGTPFGQTPEAWMFGAAFWIMQIYFAYKIAVSKDQKQIKVYWAYYVFFAAADTFTDLSFRTDGLKVDKLFAGLLVSVFLYNIFSELAVGIGFREMLVGFGSAIEIFTFIFGELKNRLTPAPQSSFQKMNERGSHKPVPNFPPMPPQQGKPSNKADMHMKMPPMAEMPMPSHEDVVQLLKRGEKQHEQ